MEWRIYASIDSGFVGHLNRVVHITGTHPYQKSIRFLCGHMIKQTSQTITKLLEC